MIDYFLQALPILAVLVLYFVRVEIRFAKLINDISWIKLSLGNVQCQKKSSKE